MECNQVGWWGKWEAPCPSPTTPVSLRPHRPGCNSSGVEWLGTSIQAPRSPRSTSFPKNPGVWAPGHPPLTHQTPEKKPMFLSSQYHSLEPPRTPLQSERTQVSGLMDSE